MPQDLAYIYLQRYLKVAPLSHALWRASEAQELAKHKLKKPILDLGCGFGEFAGVFFSSQIEVGVDIDYRQIARAAQTGKYKKTIVTDARKLPFASGTFNTVISISTLEHIPDNYRVFKEVFRVLKHGGRFIYTVPTEKLFDALLGVKILKTLGLKSIALLYFRLLNNAFKHVFLPSEEVWLNLARRAGFKIEKFSGTLPQVTIFLWEAGLIPALPSQISKILTGKRVTMLADFKIKFFKPFAKFIKTDPNFMANIIVIAKKPHG